MTFREYDVGIIGLGPAGLGAALTLADSSLSARTICWEAGVLPEERYCTILQGKGCRKVQPCQVTGGIGGASVLSAGKISAFPAGRRISAIVGDPELVEEGLERALAQFGNYVPLIPPEFDAHNVREYERSYKEMGFRFRYYDAYRYLQSDLLSGYQQMVSKLESAGMTIKTHAKVTRVRKIDSGFAVGYQHKGVEHGVQCKLIIVAVGRSGADLIANLSYDVGIPIRTNRMDVGVRLEFPTRLWPDIDSCHNDLKLHFGESRTFCVCKDGYLAPYRSSDIFLLEGSSNPSVTTGFTNFAVMVRFAPDYVASASLFEEIRDRYLAESAGIPVRETLETFLSKQDVSVPTPRVRDRSSSSILYWRRGSVSSCFPEAVASRIHHSVRYLADRIFADQDWSEISVFGPEVDYYWPRLDVESGFRSRSPGLYLIGDCSGHFRGILQAFYSGIEAVNDIISYTHVS